MSCAQQSIYLAAYADYFRVCCGKMLFFTTFTRSKEISLSLTRKTRMKTKTNGFCSMARGFVIFFFLLVFSLNILSVCIIPDIAGEVFIQTEQALGREAAQVKFCKSKTI